MGARTMPELPDITVYIEALERRVVGRMLEKMRIADVFVLRTAMPPISTLEGKRVVALRRLGKRIALGFEDGKWLVIHLMIAGRLQWSGAGEKAGARKALATFFFEGGGALVLTEAGTKHRAAIHVVADEAGLAAHDRGGIDVMTCSVEDFATALTRGNHTLKRSLTDPVLFSGVGNAYSDEILHAAKLSPVARSQKLTGAESGRLRTATRDVLRAWTERLREETGEGFPTKVTACRPEMAVHGKFGQPCPVCGTAVRRITYAENEVNYCPRCQTGGKLLADRSLSRWLKADWPRTTDAAAPAGKLPGARQRGDVRETGRRRERGKRREREGSGRSRGTRRGKVRTKWRVFRGRNGVARTCIHGKRMTMKKLLPLLLLVSVVAARAVSVVGNFSPAPGYSTTEAVTIVAGDLRLVPGTYTAASWNIDFDLKLLEGGGYTLIATSGAINIGFDIKGPATGSARITILGTAKLGPLGKVDANVAVLTPDIPEPSGAAGLAPLMNISTRATLAAG